MALRKKLIAAMAALSLVATPALAASAAQGMRVGTQVNTAQADNLFGVDDTMSILLGLLLIGGGVGLYFALHNTSP